jgi:FMN phosphatase YigB (HAD superfamily)
MGANIMEKLTLIFDFDGTLVDQKRLKAYKRIVKNHASFRSKGLAKKLYNHDLFLCSREIYDRQCVFCDFKRFFKGKNVKHLIKHFWDEVYNVQEVIPGCKKALDKLRNAGHRLVCATDTDGPDTHKWRRIQKSGLLPYFEKIFIGSGKPGKDMPPKELSDLIKYIKPPKGNPRYMECVIENLQPTPKREACVMIGDKPKSDLLPASNAHISSVLVCNPEYPLLTWPVKVKTPRQLPSVILGLISGVFISYSHYDMEFVEKLERSLRNWRIKLWRDVRDIKVGEELELAITKAIRTLPNFLVVISRHSVNAEWVNKEIDEVLRCQKTQRGRHKQILPVLIDKRVRPEDIHWPIGKLKYADFRKSFRRGLSDLRTTLEHQDCSSILNSEKRKVNLNI